MTNAQFEELKAQNTALRADMNVQNAAVREDMNIQFGEVKELIQRNFTLTGKMFEHQNGHFEGLIKGIRDELRDHDRRLTILET